MNNDWVMTFAAGLAFNLITAIFPIVIAIIAIAGFIFGSFDPSFQAHLITSIENAFPPPLNQSNILGPALTTLSKNANFLLIIRRHFRYLRWLAPLHHNRRLFLYHLPYTPANPLQAERYGSLNASIICDSGASHGICLLHPRYYPIYSQFSWQ